MFGYDSIPDGLDELPPGLGLATVLAGIDVNRVSGHDRVIVLRAHQRMTSHHQAQAYAAMASLADHMEHTEFAADPEIAWTAAATEIRVALRLTRRSAESALDTAIHTHRRVPRVWEALAAGAIDAKRARVIVDETAHLPVEAARKVTDEIIAEATDLTTGQLAARLRRLGISTDPTAAAQRYRDAVDQRRIVIEATSDGTAHLHAFDLAPDTATYISSRIHAIALTLNGTDEPRSIDQLRADTFVDLLSGHDLSQHGTIELTVDLETLTGLARDPGDLGGYGPVVADIARQIAETCIDAEWRFTITDPVTAQPVHDGTTRRRPTITQRRTVQARDRTCIFPGCRMPATQCDLDHRTPWSQDAKTFTTGLEAECRHDHITNRHRIGWTHRPLPNGTHHWTSPLGHTYTSGGSP